MKPYNSALIFVSLAAQALAGPFPQQTPSPTSQAGYSADSSSPSKSSSLTTTITTAPGLICTSGSSVLFTTDCTRGSPTSYCYSPPPPITCGPASFPSVYHPGHCIEASTCFPVNASWITTACHNGQTAYTTSTLYRGTLADGQSTIISQVQCACAQDQWYSYYSYTATDGNISGANFCMPHTNCPVGMTTSVSTNDYCATAPPESCSNIPLTTDFCKCDATSTAVYPLGGATAMGCAVVTTTPA